tara:strand:+ start:10013 stop:10315 length:303 start_codon:yes stop_codon:yes gene_type:complete
VQLKTIIFPNGIEHLRTVKMDIKLKCLTAKKKSDFVPGNVYSAIAKPRNENNTDGTVTINTYGKRKVMSAFSLTKEKEFYASGCLFRLILTPKKMINDAV